MGAGRSAAQGAGVLRGPEASCQGSGPSLTTGVLAVGPPASPGVCALQLTRLLLLPENSLGCPFTVPFLASPWARLGPGPSQTVDRRGLWARARGSCASVDLETCCVSSGHVC